VPRIKEKALRPENLHLKEVQPTEQESGRTFLKCGFPTSRDFPQEGKTDHLHNNELFTKLCNTQYYLHLDLQPDFELFQAVADTLEIPLDFVMLDSWPTFLAKNLGKHLPGDELLKKLMAWVNRHWWEFDGQKNHKKKPA
jgi:hypothetical protein